MGKQQFHNDLITVGKTMAGPQNHPPITTKDAHRDPANPSMKQIMVQTPGNAIMKIL
jgi:hypothetical protein